MLRSSTWTRFSRRSKAARTARRRRKYRRRPESGKRLGVRGLTIIKSRGTNHSNQVRELILASSGLSLASPYTADGSVLMGTMRWQKERAEGEEQGRLTAEFERQHAAIDDELCRVGLSRASAPTQHRRKATCEKYFRFFKFKSKRHLFAKIICPTFFKKVFLRSPRSGQTRR